MKRKPIRRPEQMLQRACVQLLEAFYEPMPDVFWTAINPVPAKSKAVAGVSKAMGLKPGVLDMEFIKKPPTGFYSRVLFVEFKAPGGKLSENQIKAIKAVQASNAFVRLVTSIEEFVEALASIEIFPRRKLTLRSSVADSYLTNSL